MFLDPVGLALTIVAGAVLIVVIFFFAYFNTLMLIANFTYPNAKIKALGIPFIDRERLKKLVESGTKEELVEALRSEGYAISSGEIGTESLEKAIERENLEMLRSTLVSLPSGARPFFEAYMLKYDAEAIKKVLRAKKHGKRMNLEQITLYSLDRRVLEEMLEAATLEDAKNALHGTIFSSSANERDDFSFETSLDRTVFNKIEGSVLASDGDISKKLNVFTGVLLDITNIKIVLRGIRLGIDPDRIMALTIGEGRDIAEWRLKNMAESQDIVSAISELSGTPYGEALKGVNTVEMAEKRLDEHLLNRAGQIAMENNLDVGPAIRFFVGKEMEARNLKVVNLAIDSGLSWEDIEDLLVVEVKT